MNLEQVHQLKPKFVSRVVGEGLLVLVPLTSNIAQMDKLYILNETGKFIWEMLDDTSSLKNITIRLMDHFDIDQATARKDIEFFIQSLRKLAIA